MQIAQEIAKENLAISVISVQELYEGQSTKNKIKEEHLLATISPLKILPYNLVMTTKTKSGMGHIWFGRAQTPRIKNIGNAW